MNTPEHGQKVVWITGAAGGLGQTMVREFAAQGWRVAAAFHTTPIETTNPLVWPFALDVTRSDQVAATASQIVERWGRIDALVNNAGVTDDELSWRIDDDAWEKVLAVNLKGAFLCCRAALRPMLRQGDGHILNLTSFAAKCGTRGQANYAAAKAGLIGLTESLAREVASRNIRVNAIMPGILPTRMTARLTETQVSELVGNDLLGRMNSLEEVARFIVFLANMQNVSGQVFQLDSRIARWT